MHDDRTDDDAVFKALGDPTRRFLLDLLFERTGARSTELESGLDMTRFGVMKHLKVLEEAGLVVTQAVGPGEAPLPQPGPDPAGPRPVDRQVHRASGLGARRSQAEPGGIRMTTTTSTRTLKVFRVYIKAAPERVWEAITSPEWNAKLRLPRHHRVRPAPRRRVPRLDAGRDGRQHRRPRGRVDGEIVEVDPPHRLVQTYRFNFAPDQTAEGFHEVTWDLHAENGGITRLTVTHDVTDAPIAAAMIEGSAGLDEGGGGWAFILSDLKSLLETGGALAG